MIQDSRFVGLLYRALNPVYAREPLSGRGAERYGGRFNRKGQPALYLALSPHTAIREANQVGDLQPTTLVSYRADLSPIFDSRDAKALADCEMSASDLADGAWRAKMQAGQWVPTQEFATALAEAGFVGLLVQSFAPGVAQGDLNVVLWRWQETGLRLEVVDDDNRLDRG